MVDHKPLTIGIMQGRLTRPRGRRIQFFPFGEWQNEFQIAAELGLNDIEFIFNLDQYEENPLWTDSGLSEIRGLIDRFGVAVDHICADFFMRRPLFGDNKDMIGESIQILKKLITRAAAIGARSIEIPLLDHSSLGENSEDKLFCDSIQKCLPLALESGVIISLETDLPPDRLRKLLEKFNGYPVGAVYDSGNSSSLGYDPYQEITVLKELITNVHVKDRVLRGGSVPLGTGSADFAQLFAGLRKINYQKSFTLQAARGEEGNEIQTIREQIFFLKKWPDVLWD